MWTPDVYEGAPTPVTALMASVGKAAAFAAMLRVLVAGLGHYRDDWRPVVWVLAVASLIVGPVLAIVQTDVKRMLAYSSINHAGFMLVGLEAAARNAGEADSGPGVPSVMVYMLAYAVLVVGTFAVVSLVARRGDARTDLDSFRGLGQRHAALAVALTVLLVAQAGVPFTSGFIAKFGVIGAAVDESSYALAIIAMLSTVIAAFLYLRIMVSAWIQDAPADDDTSNVADPVRQRPGHHRRRRLHARRRLLPRVAARRRRLHGAVRPLSGRHLHLGKIWVRGWHESPPERVVTRIFPRWGRGRR